MTNEPRRRSGRRGLMPAWGLAICDILCGALFLGLFAFFQLGLPMLQSRRAARQAAENPPPAATAAPTPVPAAAPTPGAGEEELSAGTEAAPEPTPDDRTEWQIRFEEQFTDIPILTENSYTSPEVSITIRTMEREGSYRSTTCYVADIYVSSLENFKTYAAHNEMRSFYSQDALEMSDAAGAIIAISGDYFSFQSYGFFVRNGEVYKTDATSKDICVLYSDGRIETYGPRDYVMEDVLARNPVQVWGFGPSLLDGEGRAKDASEMNTTVSPANPRSALGYYEPGHYCFVVVDGRQESSLGLTMRELAELFEELGCESAYNLDGGASAVMVFNGQRYSHPSNGGRSIGDILYITEAGYPPEGEGRP